jgi:branched-chain amino acid transport system ATP-binding protein
VQSFELASRAYIMENGIITLTGSAAELKSNPELKRAYLGI